MKQIVTPFKVGLLVIVAGVGFLAAYGFVRKGGLDDTSGRLAWAYFSDASGLGHKSKVTIAGINVGEIAEIRLEGTKAKLFLRIRREIPLKKDAVLSKRSESMLGDYLLDLMPGTEAAEPLEDGGQIVNVLDRTGLDQTFERMNKIAGDIQDITKSLRTVLGTEEGAGNLRTILENLTALSAAMDKTIRGSGDKLQAVLENLEGFSSDVRGLTSGQDENFRRIVLNVRGATEDVRDVLTTVKQVLGSGEGEFKQSVASLKQTLVRLDSALESVESVVKKVDSGEGTLGQLVNDKELHESLRTTAMDVGDYVGRMTHVMAEVSLRSEWHLQQASSKNYLQLKLISKPDKYYLLEIVDDPRGTTTVQTVERLPPDANQRELQTQLVTSQGLKFSAQFAKRYYFATLRFGIIENTGGAGANFHFLNDNLRLSFDLFEFGALNKDYPRLKAYANYAFLGHVFVTAGIDDAFNKTLRDRDLLSVSSSDTATRRIISGRDYFLGAGIYFTDDDIKSLLPSLPVKF